MKLGQGPKPGRNGKNPDGMGKTRMEKSEPGWNGKNPDGMGKPGRNCLNPDGLLKPRNGPDQNPDRNFYPVITCYNIQNSSMAAIGKKSYTNLVRTNRNEDHEYPFYTEGSMDSLKARYETAKDSVMKAAIRLNKARIKRDDPNNDEDSKINHTLENAKTFSLDRSEIGDSRSLSGCSFSSDGNFLTTSSITVVAKIWNLPNINLVSSLAGHTQRLTDVKFSPITNHIATASADCTSKLWKPNGTLLHTFTGHLDRLSRVSFHPIGRYIGTTSYDKTWRLWDIESRSELLVQEGHSSGVYGIDFHHDGSLAASCGLDGIARLWDLRTGRGVLELEGHVKAVFGVSFSPNGYHLATGGEDNSCRVWDLRKKRSVCVIPAHTKLISGIRFEGEEGCFFVTGSYDGTGRVWSGRDFKLVKVLNHEGRVTCVDVVGGGESIATVSHDRTIKIWSCKNGEKEKAMDLD
ncbi:hypothetical protein LXL04_017554 [Taraxacum kok-saghyz]